MWLSKNLNCFTTICEIGINYDIHIFRDEDRFRREILERIDKNNTAYLWLNAANRWLGIRLVSIDRGQGGVGCQSGKGPGWGGVGLRRGWRELTRTTRLIFGLIRQIGGWGLDWLVHVLIMENCLTIIVHWEEILTRHVMPKQARLSPTRPYTYYCYITIYFHKETCWKYAAVPFRNNKENQSWHENCEIKHCIWLLFFQDYIGALIVFAAAVCTVTVGILGHISSGLVGLAIAYALMVKIKLIFILYRGSHSFCCRCVHSYCGNSGSY